MSSTNSTGRLDGIVDATNRVKKCMESKRSYSRRRKEEGSENAHYGMSGCISLRLSSLVKRRE